MEIFNVEGRRDISVPMEILERLKEDENRIVQAVLSDWVPGQPPESLLFGPGEEVTVTEEDGSELFGLIESYDEEAKEYLVYTEEEGSSWYKERYIKKASLKFGKGILPMNREPEEQWLPKDDIHLDRKAPPRHDDNIGDWVDVERNTELELSKKYIRGNEMGNVLKMALRFDPMINPLPSKVKEVLDNEVFKAAISADDFWTAKGVTLDIVMGSGIKERDKMRILNNIETIEAEGASTTALLQYLYNSYLKYIGLGVIGERKTAMFFGKMISVSCPDCGDFGSTSIDWLKMIPRVQCSECEKWLRPIDLDAPEVEFRFETEEEKVEFEKKLKLQLKKEEKMKNRAVVPQGRFFQGRRSEPRTDLERVMNHYDVSEDDAVKMLETTPVEELLPERGTGRSEFSKKIAQEIKEDSKKYVDSLSLNEIAYIYSSGWDTIEEMRQDLVRMVKTDVPTSQFASMLHSSEDSTEVCVKLFELVPLHLEEVKKWLYTWDIYDLEVYKEAPPTEASKKTAQEEDNILFKNIVQRIKDLGGKEGIPQEVIEEYIDSLYGGFEPGAYNRDMSDEDLLGDIKLFWREVEHEEGSLIDEAFKSRLVRALVKDFIKVASEKDLQKVKDSETTQELFASLKDIVGGDSTEYLSNVWNLYKLEKDSKGDIIEKFAQDELPPMGWTVDVKKDEEASEEEKEEKEEKEEEGVSELPELPPMPEWEVTEFEEKEKVAPIEIRIKPEEKQIDVDFNAEEETPEETKEEMEEKEEETEGEKKEDLDEIESPTIF